MNRSDILNKVRDIIREEFDDDELTVTEDTAAADVEEWDSLAQLSIIHEVERTFRIRFTIEEIKNFKNVGDMMDHIMKHLEE